MRKEIIAIDEAVCKNDGIGRYYNDGTVSVEVVTLVLRAVKKHGYATVFKTASGLGIRVSDATINLIEAIGREV